MWFTDTRRFGALRVTIRFGSSESYIAAGRGCFGRNSRGRRWRGSSYLDVNAVVQSRTRVRVFASCDRSAAHRGCGDDKLTVYEHSQQIQPSTYSHSLSSYILCSYSGFLVGSTPTLSVIVLNRCRCDFSTSLHTIQRQQRFIRYHLDATSSPHRTLSILT